MVYLRAFLKASIAICVVSLLTCAVDAATNVGGTIALDTTWTSVNSPYVVTSDVVLLAGRVLTIEPGVTIEFSDGAGIVARGYVIARGTAGKHIVFTSDHPATAVQGSWSGITVQTDQGGNLTLSFGELYFADSAVQIQFGNHITPTCIYDTVFASNTLCVSGSENVYPLIERCIFKNNTTAIGESTFKIFNSLFENNTTGINSNASYVCLSTFTGNGAGMIVQQGEYVCDYFVYNSTGIQGKGSTYNGVLKGCEISNNVIGMSVGVGTEWPVCHFDKCNIYDNTMFNIRYVSGGQDIDASNCYWGTTNSAIVDAKNYDFKDDINLGRVLYSPVLSSPYRDAVSISIVSPTHTDQSREYLSNNPVFNLSGHADFFDIAGNYYLLDHSSGTIPDPGNANFTAGSVVSLDNIPDGTWYFHAIAAGSLYKIECITSNAAHYRISIKSTIDPDTTNVFSLADGTKVELPAGAVNVVSRITAEKPSASQLPALVNSLNLTATACAREIKLSNAAAVIQKDITITIPYGDAEIAGLDETKLKVAYYDESRAQWVLIPDCTVNAANNTIVFAVGHLSLFRVVGYSAPTTQVSDLSNYPNPFTAGNGNKTRIRYDLMNNADTEIHIYDLIGEPVWHRALSAGNEGAVAGPNEIIWDGKNDSGNYVTAGGYICIVKSNGKTMKTKIGVK